MNSLWLLYELLDIGLMFMNYGVVFYGLSTNVRIVFNWYLIGLRLINLYWTYLGSLSIMIYALNWCSWPWVRALWYWIGWFSIGLKCWWWSGGTLHYSPYFMLIIFQLCCVWFCPLLVAVLCELMWPYRRCFKYYDDYGLVGNYLKYYVDFCSWLCEVWSYLPICKVMWKYVSLYWSC